MENSGNGEEMNPAQVRILAGFLERFRYLAGSTFNGNRNLDVVFGYLDDPQPSDYRSRFRRNPVAARVIEAKPQSTWRGGGEIIENEDPNELTPFERAWGDLNERLDIWSKFHRVDVLAGFSEYAVLFIGAPGNFNDVLTQVPSSKDIWYLKSYTQENAKILTYDETSSSPRYGFPLEYQFSRVFQKSRFQPQSENLPQVVHYSRCIHVADGLLEDDVFGLPRLERVWNRLDDLDKVTGGGSEAFFKRADQGMHLNKDISIPVDKTGEADRLLQEQVDKYVHGLDRIIRTRGVDVKMLGSDVASFAQSVDAIISQISAGTGIPQRILMGSERGHLASTQDKDNWDEQIHDRRSQYAAPIIVRPFIQRMIDIKAIPKPVKFDVRWPQMKSLDESSKAIIAKTIAEANSANKDTGGVIVTVNEIRDKILGMLPIDPKEAIAALPPEIRAASGLALQLVRKRIVIGYYDKKAA